MTINRSQGGPIESRLIGLFASLFFSVPTALLIWLGANKQLAYFQFDFFISSRYLFASMVAFGLLALLFPRLFPSILGGIWRGIVKIQHLWGW